ncbi:MAG: hypothetical protein HDT32_03600 [Clostridiales bacterium]|nr:hypothetical protein [Clostridiales bacterium]
MAKKNKGNKSNNNRPQPTVKQETVKVVKPEVELTSEEREALREQGQKEKERLIQEGEEEKQRLINEGEAEKKKIIEKANKEVEKSIGEVQSQYKKEVKEEAEADAKIAADKIISQAHLVKEDVEAKQKELEQKTENLDLQYEELASKMEQFTKDSLELENQKKSYKTDVLKDVDEQIKGFNSAIASLEQEKDELVKELKKKERELNSSNDDKDYYMQELEKSDARKQRVMELEHKIDSLEQKNQILDETYKKCKAENEEYYRQIQRFGQNPTALIDERNRLEKENMELRDRLTKVPADDEIVRLRTTADENSQIAEELKNLKIEKIETDRKLAELDIYRNDLENSRRFIRVLELQRVELQRELDRIQENYNSRQDNVFASLSAIDDEKNLADYPRTGRSLKQICEDFRNYLASRNDNPLYYSMESIRTFFAGLAAARIIILQGMSGTGKSSLPNAFAEYMMSITDRIEVQSSWKDRNDLLGFYNDFEKRYKETKFLEALYRATRDRNNVHLIMLDEMNLSRIEYYFADFLSALEEEKPENRKVNLISRDVRGVCPEYIVEGNLSIGDNTWFIGTANKDDSTFAISDKVYDRAIVLEFDKREEEFSVDKSSYPRGVSYAELNVLLTNASSLSPEMKKEIKGHVDWLDERMQTYFEISFGNRISKQIYKFVPAYVTCGGKIEEAIDTIFVTKVLRKLQGFYDESTKKGLEEFLSDLRKSEKDDKFKMTRKAIQNMIDRI